MKHTLRLAPGKFVNLDSYKRPGIHPLYPIVAMGVIGLIVIGASLSMTVHQAKEICPTDRREYYGPGC